MKNAIEGKINPPFSSLAKSCAYKVSQNPFTAYNRNYWQVAPFEIPLWVIHVGFTMFTGSPLAPPIADEFGARAECPTVMSVVKRKAGILMRMTYFPDGPILLKKSKNAAKQIFRRKS